jgi:hypothetical protein
MESKIIIRKPVFYQESPSSPLYQLLSFEPGSGSWCVHNVIAGCESPKLDDIKFNFSFNKDRFMQHHEGDNIIEETVEATKVLEYFSEIGITVFDDFFKGFEPKAPEIEKELVSA